MQVARIAAILTLALCSVSPVRTFRITSIPLGDGC
jgi:hypothetical protein